MPDVVVEHGCVHAAVGVAGVAVGGAGRHQPLLHVQEELLHGADHGRLQGAVGRLLVGGVRVEVATEDHKVSVGAVDPLDQLLEVKFEVWLELFLESHGISYSK